MSGQKPISVHEGAIGKRILIVDHEERLVYFLRASLENLGLGYEVATATSGKEAVEAMEHSRFDLLITAFEIPGIDGLELIRKVKERSPATLSILMAANGSPELEARAHLLQVYEYLTKPFSVDWLMERVQIALGDALFPVETWESDQGRLEPPPEGRDDLSEEAAYFWEPELHEEVMPPVLEEPEQAILASAPPASEPPFSEEVKEEQPVFAAEAMAGAREKVISALSPHRFEALYNCLSDLRFEVGAQCVLLADTLGELMAEVGVTTELDTTTLVSLLAGGYATTFEMTRQLGERRSFNLNFHEGERYDIYSSNVGDDFLLIILCDREVGPSRVGMVWLYAKRAIEKLLAIMAQEEKIEAREALGDEFGSSLRSELDNIFGEEPRNRPLSPEEGDLRLNFEEAKARGLVGDNIFLPPSDDGEEDKDATGREFEGF